MGFDFDVLLADIDIAHQRVKTRFPNAASVIRSTSSGLNKCNVTASEYRSLGNEKYKVKWFYEALEWYTKSVAFATEDSEELTLAYGNRSAVLFYFRRYVPCLLDINRALTVNDKCPQESKVKLLERKKKCLGKIRSEGRGLSIDEDGTDPSSVPAKNSREEWRNTLKNALLPNTSSKIRLACNEKWGRYWVAAADIEPGEILGSEEFFTTFMNTDRLYNHCSFCLVMCEALIPCTSCTKMMYCSEACRTRAFESYHRTECKLWSFYLDEGFFGENILALRTFFSGTVQGAMLKDLMKRLNVRDIFKEKVNLARKPFQGDYLTVLRQRWTFDKPPKEYVLLAVTMTVVLRYLDFFEEHDSEMKIRLNETELFSTLLLLNNFVSTKFYNYAISESVATKNDPSSDDETPFGCGITPLHNMMNHSCNPNVRDSVRLREHFIYSVRPIKKGEQIFGSYCISFAKVHIAERRRKLGLYGFTCYCEACTNNWPTILLPMFDRPEFQIINSSEEVSRNIMTRMKSMRRIHRALEDRDETLQNAVQCRKMLHNKVSEPSKLTALCEELIVCYMRKRYGNYYVVPW